MKMMVLITLLIGSVSFASTSKRWSIPAATLSNIVVKGVNGRLIFKESDTQTLSVEITLVAKRDEDIVINIDSLKPMVVNKELVIELTPDLTKRDWVEKAQSKSFVKTNVTIIGPSKNVTLSWRQGDISFLGWKQPLSVQSIQSNLNLRNIETDVKVHNQSGKMTLVDSKGSFEADGYNNIISISNFEGPVNIENYMGQTSVNSITGDVKIEQNKGRLLAKNIKGSFSFNNRLATVEFSKVDGSVRGQGLLGDVVGKVNGEADIRIKTERGRVQLKTSSSAASVNLGTSEGSISAPRYLKMTRYASFQHATGRLRGQHKGNIYVRTKSGSINLR